MLGLLLTSSVLGQVPNLPKTPTEEGTEQLTSDKLPSGVHELTAVDVEAFLDGIVPLQLKRDDIAGATVAVVKRWEAVVRYSDLVLFFMAPMTGLVVYASTHIEFLSDRESTWFHLAQAIGVLGAIGTLIVVYNGIQSWRNREKRIWVKLQATLFVLLCLEELPIAN